MNKLKIIVVVSMALIVSMMVSCTFSSANPTSTVTTQDAGLLKPQSATPNSRFVLGSPEVEEGGQLPKDYTCDGSSATLPLKWGGEPANTMSFALVMYTIPNPGESHWYWVLYNISSSVHELVKNVSGAGTLGNNSVNHETKYAPPCSKGPGPKLYTYTIYALSSPPRFTIPTAGVSRDVLLAAIQDRTLGRADLNVFYSREK